ncbi:mannosyl transferase [Drepanopeziza brunnea f. sp. 'multigermtubi' MB_m1]|uniref:Mannosyl transferase n=1 Tax=Marssonina brunnea f. sp. multigermtubi (strain MB_m1) TaxID=1072389 RepID=K1XD18_MARBU|nr:mannosyl transferase [Drepanopeziza brunnea f. sp. 'multigermtubi' MB_m1]EKD18668.1 mannosyl transferase [Drepanopeziza brunnea f. sp. 'multigermtubi' MB_m1]
MDKRFEKCKAWVEDVILQTKSYESVQRASGNTKVLLYGAFLLAFTSWLLIRAVHYLIKPGCSSRPSTPDLEKPSPARKFKAPDRKLGEWPPQAFKRPTAAPYPGWNTDVKPELDNHYLKYHADKARRILERGPKASHTDPSAFDGACELLEELTAYLPERYPTLYRATPVGMDNLVTGESFNVVERPLIEDPMQMAARMTQDDLAIMFERADGQYYLLAGSILLAGFWKLEDKLGMPLSEIHYHGDVPGYREKLEKGMMNFFRRVQPDGPVQRVTSPFPLLSLPPSLSLSLSSLSDLGISQPSVSLPLSNPKQLLHPSRLLPSLVDVHRAGGRARGHRRLVLGREEPGDRAPLLPLGAADAAAAPAQRRRRLHHPHLLPPRHGDLRRAVRARPPGERRAELGRRRRALQGERDIWGCAAGVSGSQACGAGGGGPGGREGGGGGEVSVLGLYGEGGLSEVEMG